MNAINNRTPLSAPEEILSNIKIEPDDSELKLQITLKKARRLKLQEAVTESKNSVEKVHHIGRFPFYSSQMSGCSRGHFSSSVKVIFPLPAPLLFLPETGLFKINIKVLNFRLTCLRCL